MNDATVVAVLADIHGNLAALDAVLDDLATQPHDTLVIAGDIALNGPRPAETMARVRALGVPTLLGTNDWCDRAECRRTRT